MVLGCQDKDCNPRVLLKAWLNELSTDMRIMPAASFTLPMNSVQAGSMCDF